MRGRRRAAVVLASAALGGAACNDELCTRDSECPIGLVCSADATCVLAPDASPDNDDAGVAAAAPSPDGGFETFFEPPIK
jgi:hypothetical protein